MSSTSTSHMTHDTHTHTMVSFFSSHQMENAFVRQIANSQMTQSFSFHATRYDKLKLIFASENDHTHSHTPLMAHMVVHTLHCTVHTLANEMTSTKPQWHCNLNMHNRSVRWWWWWRNDERNLESKKRTIHVILTICQQRNKLCFTHSIELSFIRWPKWYVSVGLEMVRHQ